jgi:hypothetical protein
MTGTARIYMKTSRLLSIIAFSFSSPHPLPNLLAMIYCDKEHKKRLNDDGLSPPMLGDSEAADGMYGGDRRPPWILEAYQNEAYAEITQPPPTIQKEFHR